MPNFIGNPVDGNRVCLEKNLQKQRPDFHPYRGQTDLRNIREPVCHVQSQARMVTVRGLDPAQGTKKREEKNQKQKEEKVA